MGLKMMKFVQQIVIFNKHPLTIKFKKRPNNGSVCFGLSEPFHGLMRVRWLIRIYSTPF